MQLIKNFCERVYVKNTGKNLSGIFPGRFQPFTNAHLKRIERIIQDYQDIYLTIIVGDVGTLNRENFLTPDERVEMISLTLNNRGIEMVKIKVVKGGVPNKWVKRLKEEVENFEIVFSDNPFVTQPLQYAGYKTVEFIREGENSDSLRNKPFELWKDNVPVEVYNYMRQYALFNRMLRLPSTGRYPFLPKENPFLALV